MQIIFYQDVEDFVSALAMCSHKNVQKVKCLLNENKTFVIGLGLGDEWGV